MSPRGGWLGGTEKEYRGKKKKLITERNRGGWNVREKEKGENSSGGGKKRGKKGRAG